MERYAQIQDQIAIYKTHDVQIKYADLSKY